MHQGAARRFLRSLADIYGESTCDGMLRRLDCLESYLNAQYPGAKDDQSVQILKGSCREFEAEVLWGQFGQ